MNDCLSLVLVDFALERSSNHNQTWELGTRPNAYHLNLQEYLDKKRSPSPAHREHCHVCNRSATVCLCHLILPFDTHTRFVILMHPKEARKQKTGTGRLCHLALKNSRLHIGVDFTEDPFVRSLIEDTEYTSVLLFPSPGAVNLSQGSYQSMSGSRKKLQIFIVDGTWPLAGKILRLSKNLRALPTVSFTARQPSGYQFKKQPRADYLSTLESIQLLLELGKEQGAETPSVDLGQLPKIFERLVQIQLQLKTSDGNTADSSIQRRCEN